NPAALRVSALDKVAANLHHRGAWTDMTKDPRFTTSVRGLLHDAQTRGTAVRIVDKLNLSELAPDVLEVARQTDVDQQLRAHALEVAARLKPQGIETALRAMLDDPQPQVAHAALRGLVDLQDIRSLREIFSSDQFSPAVRQAAAQRLVDTTSGALVLLR